MTVFGILQWGLLGYAAWQLWVALGAFGTALVIALIKGYLLVWGPRRASQEELEGAAASFVAGVRERREAGRELGRGLKQ